MTHKNNMNEMDGGQTSLLLSSDKILQSLNKSDPKVPIKMHCCSESRHELIL